jgi:hypothetical protein
MASFFSSHIHELCGRVERTNATPVKLAARPRFNVNRGASTLDLLLGDGFEPYYLSRTG